METLWWVVGGLIFVATAAFLAWLGAKDRRWIFLGIAFYVIVPLIWTFGLPKVKVTKEVRDLYEFVEELPEGSNVLLTCDYDPGSKPELHPMTFAVMEHLCRRDMKFAVIELWPAGIGMANEVLEKVARQRHKKKDRIDFAHLGFKTGAEVVIQSIGKSLAKTYPTDTDGVPIGDIPMLRGIESVKDFDLILNISAGTPGTKEWVQQAGTRYEVPVASGCTGVQASITYPYYSSGQLVGLLGGMAAAAEYEQLVEIEGTATQGMEAQSSCHLLIVLFVIFGNAVFFWTRSKRED